MAEAESESLQYTPTWVVALVCFFIVLISLLVERGLHRLGKCLKRKKLDALFEALQKLKEELMLLGFISLLLAVFQGPITRICIPPDHATHMFPCKRETDALEVHKPPSHLLSTETSAKHCKQGKVPLLSLEALQQLHVFIFVLAVVHVIFCATTMVLGRARIHQWKQWEDSHLDESKIKKAPIDEIHANHFKVFILRAIGYWRKAAVISWLISFFKQFYVSVSKSDYIALRHGFIKRHCHWKPEFNFHEYMMRTLEADFKKIVGISWYLWLFVVIFLLLNVEGWHTYFWLAFLPLTLLLLAGAKLEHIITRLAQEARHQDAREVNPSNEHFWFNRPAIILHLIHFILFQNAFEIAFFFWIWITYGFHSCIMEKMGYIIPRLFMGVVVQVLCSYSTLPLYAIVTQMGDQFKRGIFKEFVQSTLDDWVEDTKSKRSNRRTPNANAKESSQIIQIDDDQEIIVIEGTTTSTNELSCKTQMPMPSH